MSQITEEQYYMYFPFKKNIVKLGDVEVIKNGGCEN